MNNVNIGRGASFGNNTYGSTVRRMFFPPEVVGFNALTHVCVDIGPPTPRFAAERAYAALSTRKRLAPGCVDLFTRGELCVGSWVTCVFVFEEPVGSRCAKCPCAHADK